MDVAQLIGINNQPYQLKNLKREAEASCFYGRTSMIGLFILVRNLNYVHY